MAETKTTTKTAAKSTSSKTTAATKTTKTAAPKAATTKTAKPAAPKAAATKPATAKAETKTTAAKPQAPAKTVEAAVEVKPVETKKAPAKTKKADGPMVKVTLVKSGMGRLKKQMRTLEALGLGKVNSSNVLPDNAATRGMIFVVKHLVKVEKV